MCTPAVHLELVTKINRIEYEHLVKWFTCRWRSMTVKQICKMSQRNIPRSIQRNFHNIISSVTIVFQGLETFTCKLYIQCTTSFIHQTIDSSLHKNKFNNQGSKLTTNWSHTRLDFWLCE